MPLALRLIGFSSLLICLSVGLSSYLVYRASKAELTETLGRELLAVARSSSALVDADLVELIHRGSDGEIAFREEFELLREQLDRIREANGLPDHGSPLYIMRPALDYDRSGLLEFVVMPDPDEGGRYFVGNLYPAEPHNRRAEAGVASASPLYEDQEGVWISAAAPLYDSAGTLVGQIQVDREVAYFLEAARSDALRILKGALLSIAVGALLSMVYARGLVRPIDQIAAGLRRLGEGELDHRVEIRRNDEIGELARGVNVMAASLENAREEQKTASRALVTSGRLAAVGQLAAGVAHEINNPLTYVRTNIALILDGWVDLWKRLRTGEPVDLQDPLVIEGEGMLCESLEGLDRALQIVRDIKGLAHGGSRDQGARQLVDLNDLLDGVLRVASPQLGTGIEVERRYEPIPSVPAEGQELKQVFLNLVLNANHAMGMSGRLTISTESQGDTVVVHVEDDGPGIDDAVLGQIFDPFFTTKPVGDGTGLGLSISYEIVRRHDGELRVESERGRGSRFSVVLPATVHPDGAAD